MGAGGVVEYTGRKGEKMGNTGVGEGEWKVAGAFCRRVWGAYGDSG